MRGIYIVFCAGVNVIGSRFLSFDTQLNGNIVGLNSQKKMMLYKPAKLLGLWIKELGLSNGLENFQPRRSHLDLLIPHFPHYWWGPRLGPQGRPTQQACARHLQKNQTHIDVLLCAYPYGIYLLYSYTIQYMILYSTIIECF